LLRKTPGLSVAGTKTDEIGKLAFANKITILELARHIGFIGRSFLRITEGSEEYKAKPRRLKNDLTH
jgi:hypothetical protein